MPVKIPIVRGNLDTTVMIQSDDLAAKYKR